MSNASKKIPVIARDYCTGCRMCVDACEHGCLEMDVWEFAVLSRPEQCGSEGHCMQACPNGVIAMQWVPLAAEPTIGEWRDEIITSEIEKPRRFWGLFGG